MKTLRLAVTYFFFACTAGVLHAEFVFTLQQVGPDVVAHGIGTLNLSALNLDGSGGVTSGIDAQIGYIAGGTAGSIYGGFSGPASFGAGDFVLSSTSVGDAVGIQSNFFLTVPIGYVSGTPLSNTMTFSNATFASLGFTPGTYTFNWGSGGTADSFVVTSVVPESNVSVLLGIGLAMMLVLFLREAYLSRRKEKSLKVVNILS